MFDVRGIALGLSVRSPFELPTRPQRPERRPQADDGASRLIRSVRATLARALDEAEAGWRPRVSRYPY